MTAPRFRLVLPLALIGLSLMSVSRAAPPPAGPTVTYRGDPSILTPSLPSDWTIVLHEHGYESFPDAESTSRSCPEIVVLEDETIIWLVNQRGRFQSRSFDPENWRIGKVDRVALARLHRLVESQRFFSTPAEKLATRKDPTSHGITTTVALKFAGKARVVSVYSLYFEADGV